MHKQQKLVKKGWKYSENKNLLIFTKLSLRPDFLKAIFCGGNNALQINCVKKCAEISKNKFKFKFKNWTKLPKQKKKIKF